MITCVPTKFISPCMIRIKQTAKQRCKKGPVAGPISTTFYKAFHFTLYCITNSMKILQICEGEPIVKSFKAVSTMVKSGNKKLKSANFVIRKYFMLYVNHTKSR